MTPKARFIITNLVGLAGALSFYIFCRQSISFDFNGMPLATTPGFLVIISYVIGAVIGSASVVPFISGKLVENAAKLKEWQNQDAKLALEVQSDKEKQLEQKILTLESALKQALNKQA